MYGLARADQIVNLVGEVEEGVDRDAAADASSGSSASIGVAR